jgi:PAS domain S-box-containing protein
MTEPKTDSPLKDHPSWPSPEARAVLDSMKEFFVAIDRSYNIVFVNRALAQASPDSSAPILGKNHWDLWPEMRGSVVEESYERAFRLGLPVSFEYHHEQSGVWVSVSAYPQGDLLHVFFTDITDRRAGENLLRAMVDSIPQIAWATGEDMTPTHLNRRWYEYTGLSEDTPYDPVAIVHPDDLPELHRLWVAARELGEGLQGEGRLRRHDGQYRWHLIRVEPRRENSRIIGWFGTSTDIHEMKEATTTLRTSEARYHATFELAAVGIAHVDLEGRWLRLNDALLEILGYPREELLGKSFGEITHPDDLEEDEAQVRRLLAGEIQRYSMEKRYVRKDGGIVWASLTVSLVRGDNGKPQYFVSVVQDVTARKEAERALRESEAALRSFYDCSPLLMGVVEVTKDDSDIVHLYDSPSTERLFGRDRGRTEGQSARALGAPPEVIREWIDRYRQSEREGGTVRFEYAHPTSGRQTWLSSTVCSLGDSRFAYVMEDVTERKQAEEALRRSDRRRRFLLDLNDAVAATSSPREIIRRASQMTGEELNVARCGYALVYQEADLFVVENDHVRGVASVAGSYALSSLSEEQISRHLNGTPVLVNDTALDPVTAPHYERLYAPLSIRSSASIPLLKDGVWVATFAVQHDEPRDWTKDEVTLLQDVAQRVWEAMERARAELALREANASLEAKVAERTADLRASNEALNGFTYHVAHDLRSPIRSIVSTSRIVQEDFGDGLPAEARDLLSRQAAAATKLGQLVDDLLRLSRLSQQPLMRTEIDLTRLAREVAAESIDAHDRTAVRVEVEEGLAASADANLLRLALGNLVENGVKYSPGGGTVRVGRRADGAFFVSDEGIGIEPKFFDKIFEPFQRLHRDSEFAGTGIGLSNVKQVIERHGGQVWVESELGKGSTFLFTLG